MVAESNERQRKELGNAVWKVLHFYAEKATNKRNTIRVIDTFFTLLELYPCKTCNENLYTAHAKHLSDLDRLRQRVLSDENCNQDQTETLRTWAFNLHNAVNESIIDPSTNENRVHPIFDVKHPSHGQMSMDEKRNYENTRRKEIKNKLYEYYKQPFEC